MGVPTKASKQSPYNTEFNITGKVTPGDLLSTQEVTYQTKSDLLSGISHWLQCLQSELVAIPVQRKLDAQKRELEGLLQKFEDLPDEYFTQEEAEILRQKLTELENEMKRNLQQSDLPKREVETRLAELHSEIETLKQNVEVLKKKGWVSSLLVRIANWMKDPNNRELLKSGAEVAQTLLLEAGKKQP